MGMTQHKYRQASRFFWGEDVDKTRPSCTCGWVGHWHQGFSRDHTASEEWRQHVRNHAFGIDVPETDPPLDPPGTGRF